MNKKSQQRLHEEQKYKDKHDKKCWYRGIHFSSVFEVEVATYLDQLNIKWERNEKAFEAIMEDGNVKHYIPDIFLPDYNCFVEIKGIWFSKDKRIKTYKAVEQNNLNWVYILLKEWKKSKRILRYRIEKYDII